MTDTGPPTLHAAELPLNVVQADLFKSLGHPARIRVLEVLSEGERTVAELMPLIGLEASHLSQQLSVLRGAGLVHRSRNGANVTYTLSHPLVVHLLAVGRSLLHELIRDRIESLAELQNDPTPL